jgi:hypothetical protein
MKTVEKIIHEWTEVYHFTLEGVTPKSRKFDIRVARQVLVFCLRKFTELSLSEIGAMVDQDHATIIHSCKIVEETYMRDCELKKNIKNLIRRLNEFSDTETIQVELTRADLYQLLPNLEEYEKQKSLTYLWNKFYENTILKLNL